MQVYGLSRMICERNTAAAGQQPHSVGRAPGIMSNCFNSDGWFGAVGAGRNLSLLSLFKPECQETNWSGAEN